ncbi:type VII secretion target [Nocardia sp. NBC_01329]|uniref:type VII secretion target n=1 Tax=Nocardia sp. NBC_01329 TaxID=2903594 RepID=UPI002E0E029D|nr:ESX-1 secretion-associated protein [Nocardia sp. NBC_01329]
MPERLEIDPEVLRQLAEQHLLLAGELDEWAKPPAEWLANFEPTYGKIANPVRVALVKYYDARQRAGRALAREHEQTAESLRRAAESYELADQDSGSLLGRNGEEFLGGPSSSVPLSQATGSPNFLPTGAAGALLGSTVNDPSAPAASGAAPNTAPGSGAQAPGTSPVTTPAGAMAGASGPAADGGTGTNSSTPPGGAPAAANAPGDGHPPAGTAGLAGGPVGPVSGAPGDDRSVGQSQNAAAANGMPVPVAATPFGSAVAAARDKAAEPDYVVGEEVSEDLILARTLLGAVLAAVESPVGTAWAVSVMRGPAGAGIFITSNEGRGWLPAGLYLPREVSTPWLWDELLRSETSPGSPWEGVSDPARVLVEFGLAWGAKANAQLSALVSSGPIDAGLRVHLTGVPMEGMVGPSYDVDLRVFTPDTVDRLGLAGSVPAIEGVAALPDAQIRARCLELAVDAQTQLNRAVAAPAESVGVRNIRDRILARLQASAEVPREWWNELRDADDLIAATMISRRVDVGRVGLGDLRVDDEVAILRTLAWERRCNELVTLLDQEENRQLLRDAVFAHEQVVQHPSFVTTPAPVSTGTDERIEIPAASSGAVSAPEGAVAPPAVAAGPPSGAVAPPVSPPTERGQS